MEDSKVVLRTSCTNLLQNNEICCTNTSHLEKIGLKVRSGRNETLPLIFLGNHTGIELIRCDTGESIAEFSSSKVTLVKWYIPPRYLPFFPDSDPDEELGILTVNSQNVLRLYPEESAGIKLKSKVVGIFTSYFRENGRINLAVLAVESDGTVTRWVPSSNSTTTKKVTENQVKFISDVNLILELSNLLLSTSPSDSRSTGNGLDSSCSWPPNLEEYLRLNTKLILVTNEEMCMLDSTNLDLLNSIKVPGTIRAVYPFLDPNPGLKESLIVIGTDIKVLDLNGLHFVQGYSDSLNTLVVGTADSGNRQTVELENEITNKLNVADILYLKVDLSNPNLFIISSRCQRVYLLDVANNKLTNFINIPTHHLYTYHYKNIPDHDESVKVGNGSLFSKQASYLEFGCLGFDGTNLVGFNLFRRELIYNKIAIRDRIKTMANSQLQPNLLLMASSRNLIQLDMHYSFQSKGKHPSLDRPNSRSLSHIQHTTGNETDGKNADENYDDTDANLQSLPLTKILTNNQIGIKYYNNPNHKPDVNGLRPEVTCISVHPRLPNICSVSYTDGSLYLLFIEHENQLLFHYLFVHKFRATVKNLVWYLAPNNPIDTTLGNDPATFDRKRWNKNSFLQRVFKSIDSAKYTSLILVHVRTSGQNSEPVRLGPGKTFQDKVFYMKLSEKPTLYDLTMDSSHRLFNMFVIQYPVMNGTGEAAITYAPNGSEGTEITRPLYTNFSLIYDYLCLTHYAEDLVLLTLILIDSNLKVQTIKRFRITVRGAITNISLTTKQYNQYHLYANVTTNNTEADLEQTGRCINSLQQFLMISTNLGYLYITSLLQLYNNSVFNGSLNKVTSDEHLQMDEISIYNASITHLSHTILYSPLKYNANGYSTQSPRTGPGRQCHCNDKCYFIIAVGVDGCILLNILHVDHTLNRYKLLLFNTKSADFTNFLFINEPFHYFKFLINSTGSLTQYHYNYDQISSFMYNSKHKDIPAI